MKLNVKMNESESEPAEEIMLGSSIGRTVGFRPKKTGSIPVPSTPTPGLRCASTNQNEKQSESEDSHSDLLHSHSHSVERVA